ncbi:energy-coupling factor ABC transporter ATP-binding protein [Altericista sp. CCNU0014]|uniref:energy-coupling factor ABC transporter ATP-binding protein n=1 Tax=Altericista sp. CCNU0014 TaxID=3082949 RepID=UPI00384C68C7
MDVCDVAGSGGIVGDRRSLGHLDGVSAGWAGLARCMEQLNSSETVSELRLEQVSVVSHLGHTRLLDRISFAVDRPGCKIGIVGASGAGKTTLLRLLNRLAEPSEGQIFWRGQPLSHYPVPSLRQQVMLVPQEPQLLGMTVEQALAYPLQLQGFPPAEVAARIERWEQRLDIPEEWRSRSALELSAGQRQWVSLARGFVAQPQLLLLDEPASSLDPGKTELLIRVLGQIGGTVAIVSHQLAMIQKLCDRILWIDRGQLRQDKTRLEMDWEEVQSVLSKKSAAAVSDWNDFD